MKNTIVIGLVLLMVLGCSKEDPAVSVNAAQPTAQQPQAAPPAATVRKLPQADKSIPFTQYVEISDGAQVDLMYYAYSGMPVPWEKLAEQKSSEYLYEKDGFRRNDMLKALQPRLAEDIEGFKAKRYFSMLSTGGLGHYDFASKAFPLTGIQQDQAYSFGGGGWIHPVNAGEFQRLKVEDEAKAKELEALVSKSMANGGLKIYFFAQDAEEVSGRKTIQAQITRIEILSPARDILPSTRTGPLEREESKVIATL